MTNRPAPFKQVDVTRAIKGAENANMEVAAAYIKPDGTIIVIAKGEEVLGSAANIDRMLGIQ